MPVIKKIDDRYTPDGATIGDVSYDMRTDAPGKLSSVKDQGSTCGACWTFAAYGAMESMLLPTETWDFSENNMKNEHGFDFGHCSGGNTFMSNAYLARWAGPKREVDDPYNEGSGTSDPADTYKHLEEALYISSRTSSTDNDGIKQAILDYGAVSSNMFWVDTASNSAHNSYYYDSGTDSNHAIVIVGWNDNYAASNFNTNPGMDGAFIVRNSWGSTWGDGGYFYASYADTVIGRKTNLVYNVIESTFNYKAVYEYDPLGWVSSIGYSNTVGHMANIFTATGNHVLSAASFYTTDINVDYVVDVYDNVNVNDPTDGTLLTTKSGSFTNAGYHTVSFSTVSVTLGLKFSIVVKLTNTVDEYPLAIEYPYTDYSMSASTSTGADESYISSNGTVWSHLTDSVAEGNVCIKAFVHMQDVSPPSDVTNVNDGSGADINYTNSDTQLSANWGSATDEESGIARYWYAVGTTQGATDTIGWTDNGFDVSVTTAGLSLTYEETYYFSVKA
ncbi:MAG: hypothetical protein KAJ48_08610, partial [Elusimicrobiales bacterium]|nr:hypothetical protein [Elusimicrobiales bacterium]